MGAITEWVSKVKLGFAKVRNDVSDRGLIPLPSCGSPKK
jgi:hypothetical protein